MEIRKAFVSPGWRERGTRLKKDSEIVDITISQEKLCFRGKKRHFCSRNKRKRHAKIFEQLYGPHSLATGPL